MVLSQTAVQSLSMDILRFCCVDYLLHEHYISTPFTNCNVPQSWLKNLVTLVAAEGWLPPTADSGASAVLCGRQFCTLDSSFWGICPFGEDPRWQTEQCPASPAGWCSIPGVWLARFGWISCAGLQTARVDYEQLVRPGVVEYLPSPVDLAIKLPIVKDTLRTIARRVRGWERTLIRTCIVCV